MAYTTASEVKIHCVTEQGYCDGQEHMEKDEKSFIYISASAL